MRLVRRLLERGRALREEPVRLPAEVAGDLRAQHQQPAPLALRHTFEERGAALKELAHVGPARVRDDGGEIEERRALFAPERREQMRRRVEAVRGQLIRPLGDRLDERSQPRELLHRKQRQQVRPRREEHRRERDRLPVAAVEVAAQHRPLGDALLVEIRDGARAGAEVGRRQDRGVLGEVAAGVHPAAEDGRAELLHDQRAGAEVLRRGLPRPERVLGQRQAFLRPRPQVVLGESA